MKLLVTILSIIAFGFGCAALGSGFYFYMVHGEGKIMMSVGALLVALGIIGFIVL